MASIDRSDGPGRPAPSHHTPRGFRNPEGDPRRGPADLLRWRLEARRRHVPGPDAYHFPLAKNDPRYLRANGTDPTVTWVGHATVLVQMGGRNVLTDPHFTARASPVAWAGPRRAAPPGLQVEDLPPIHLVVISHDHYDSLDAGTVRALASRPGGADTVWAVPLGLDAWLRERGVAHVVALDWWESAPAHGLEVTAVPARHWSKRRLVGRNRTLWAGWVVAAPAFRFFFCGDSGYGPLFKSIGERLGPFDLAAIPIGAYAPRWFMGPFHMDPEEAVRVHREVKSRLSVAIHWGTFVLTDEPLNEPPGRLAAARAAAGVEPGAFRVLQHGQTLVLPGPSGKGPGTGRGEGGP